MLHKRVLVLLEYSTVQYTGRGLRNCRFVAVLITNIPIVFYDICHKFPLVSVLLDVPMIYNIPCFEIPCPGNGG